MGIVIPREVEATRAPVPVRGHHGSAAVFIDGYSGML